MRKAAKMTLVGGVAAAVASTGLVAGSAEAFTQRELKVCWANTSATPGIDLLAVADGPSYRETSLDAGECVEWDVRPGRYDITVDDAAAFRDAVFAACPGPGEPSLTIRVKRQGQGYRAYNLGALVNGKITTTVRKDRSTSIAAHLRCV